MKVKVMKRMKRKALKLMLTVMLTGLSLANHAKNSENLTFVPNYELLKLTSAIVKSTIMSDRTLNEQWSGTKRCLLKISNKPNYIRERLDLILQAAKSEDVQSIQSMNEYLKTNAGKALLKSLDVSLLIQLKEMQSDYVSHLEIEKARQYLEEANLNQENYKNLNVLAKGVMTTNAVILTNKYLAKESGDCSKLKFNQLTNLGK